MNVPGIDNRQMALNIMHWLSRQLDPLDHRRDSGASLTVARSDAGCSPASLLSARDGTQHPGCAGMGWVRPTRPTGVKRLAASLVAGDRSSPVPTWKGSASLSPGPAEM